MKKLLTVLGLSSFLLVGCRSQVEPVATPTPTPAVQEVIPQEPTGNDDGTPIEAEGTSMEKGGVKEFTVKASDFAFDVKEIKVSKGDTVRIVFQNTKGNHDWVIDEFSAKTKQLQSGEEEVVEFVASKAGTFEYYCSVGQHRKMGMVGKLIVQ